MQTLRKIDIAENVEEIELICILASIDNCPIYNQPEFCHHEASGLATISVFPLGVRNMGAFPLYQENTNTKSVLGFSVRNFLVFSWYFIGILSVVLLKLG